MFRFPDFDVTNPNEPLVGLLLAAPEHRVIEDVQSLDAQVRPLAFGDLKSSMDRQVRQQVRCCNAQTYSAHDVRFTVRFISVDDITCSDPLSIKSRSAYRVA